MPDGRTSHFAFVLAALALVTVHLLLVRHYFGAAWLAEIPYTRGDFSTHAAQVNRVLEAWQTAGRHWAYDVQLLAGAPNGVLFDADNKGWELWTWALVRLGVGEGRAFNAFVLMVHLVMPAVVFAAARILRLDRGAALTATGLAIALWGFDSFTRWMWFIGTVSYVFVAYFALLPMAAFHRWLEDRKLGWALLCALSLALAHLVHPYVFFILVGPMLAEYVRAAVVERSLSRTEHFVTLAIALVTIAANAWWLRTALRFVHYLLDSAYFEQSGLSFVIYDALGLLHDAHTQGWIGVRTGVRLACVIAAMFGLRAWRRAGDRRWLPVLTLIAIMAVFTYVGGHTPLAQVQPYRHALPLGFALLLPAAWWLTQLVRTRVWRGMDGRARALAIVLGLLGGQYLIHDALYFFASELPDHQELADGTQVPLGTLGHAHTPAYGYEDQHDWERLIAWVAEQDRLHDGQSRWLVQDQVLGECLMARTRAPIMGGFLVRNLEHSDANWFRHAGVAPPYDAARLRRYLDTYAVRWVIVPKAHAAWWDAQTDLVARDIFLDGMIVYRVRRVVGLIDGGGQVRAEINRIHVTDSDPQRDVVLRFHWLETLTCSPDCTIVREPVEGDRVGFIRVPAPHPRAFVLDNGYSF